MVHLHTEVIFSWTFLELVIWTISFNMQNSRMCFVEVTVDFIIIVYTRKVSLASIFYLM